MTILVACSSLLDVGHRLVRVFEAERTVEDGAQRADLIQRCQFGQASAVCPHEEERVLHPQHRQGALQVVGAKGVEHQVVPGEHLGEVGRSVVDDLIGTEIAHPVDISCAHSGRHVCTEVLGNLNRSGTKATGPSVHKDALARLHSVELRERLPSPDRRATATTCPGAPGHVAWPSCHLRQNRW